MGSWIEHWTVGVRISKKCLSRVGTLCPPPDLGPYWEKKGPGIRRVLPPYWNSTPLLVKILLTGFFRFRARWKTRFLVIFTGFFVENTSFPPPLLDFYPPIGMDSVDCGFPFLENPKILPPLLDFTPLDPGGGGHRVPP